MAALLSVVVGVVIMIVMLATKNVSVLHYIIRVLIAKPTIHYPKIFGYVFSDDINVVKLVSEVMPFVASFQVADGLAGSCGGVLRGQGEFE